ncbi:MAG: 3-phosphoshikimate 1-carboxyvinyltransferase [Chloroflexota bacterium]|nr:3-phosphoshikimate 1-carboxyvinyltransferase [Chloroflexota bacterium]
MSLITVRSTGSLCGSIRVPGDKSISHRTLLLACLAEGDSEIRGFLPSADCLATLRCIRALGIAVDVHDRTTLIVHGRGLYGLRRADGPLNCARSGTTMRLLAGILAGQPFAAVLTGDPQLLRRPMERIALPLRQMGADIATTHGHAPLTIRRSRLRGREHILPVASAQVKSAIMLAGLYADGPTIVHQPGPARDHTELMLAAMGANVEVSDLIVTLTPGPPPLSPLDLTVPGDISSACFPLVAALLLPGSEITVEGVGVNPTRTGLLDVLDEMGARIEVNARRQQGGEPVALVTARASDLHGVQVSGETVVRMIDEFPLLAVAATQAQGSTVVRDAAELRVKETDRIATIASELRKMGADIDPRPDGFVVRPTPLQGAVVDSHGDHRIAMALAVAGLVADGETTVKHASCIDDSFPRFVDTMQRLGAPMT